jgi:alcohol dehydrogenase class IV
MRIDPKSLTGNWSYPTEIRFGPGRIRELPQACTALGIARPLLVTDPGLADFPMIRVAVAANDKTGVPTGVFSAIRPNPGEQDIEAGIEAYRAGRHDGVIAIGGGSALDAGKAIAFMCGQSRPLCDFEDLGDNWRRARTGEIAPVIALPTTAGTGSEVGRAAVISDPKDGVKRIIFHPRMMPGIVIADPELTIGLPPHLTAATGMDALTHCLEALCAPGFHPMADGIAGEGLRQAARWLPNAYKQGADIEARAYMLVAAAMGAVAFQKGLGGVHAISHAVGALYDTHHGLTNAVVLPYVLRFNRSAVDEKMTMLARLLDLPELGFDGVFAWILELRASLKIPHSLKELGVDGANAGRVSEMAYADPTRPGNPKPLSRADLETLFVDAVDGRL